MFYTDSFYWDQMQGKDFDESTTDDWDVDTGVYYGYGPRDRQARDLAQMQAEGSLDPDAYSSGRYHDPDAQRELLPGAFERYSKVMCCRKQLFMMCRALVAEFSRLRGGNRERALVVDEAA